MTTKNLNTMHTITLEKIRGRNKGSLFTYTYKSQSEERAFRAARNRLVHDAKEDVLDWSWKR